VKNNWSKIAVALGPAMVMVTVVWEMVRTNPAYNFLVEPWALSGYETDQGWTYFAVGLVLLLLGLAVMPKRSVEIPYSAAVVAFAVVASSILGLVFGPATVSITFSGVITALLTLLTTMMLYRFFKSLVIPRVAALDRTVVRLVAWFGTFIGLFLLLSSTVGGSTVEMNTALAMFLGTGLLGLYALATSPHGLAANRVVIFSSVLGGAVIGMSGGSLRTALLDAQIAATGVSAQYKDVQVGYGWFIALFGIIILFVGAVALWATRRDIMIARTRAKDQRAAAEKSAKEIQEANEQYQREKAEAAASSAPATPRS